MVQIRKAEISEFEIFATMEAEDDVREFIIPCSADEHRKTLKSPDVHYLSIDHGGSRPAGFIILARDRDGYSIEFRRIVVAAVNRGIGQEAVAMMEEYCRENLQLSRIWLDVFAHNCRGIHIYEKAGYRQFDTGELDGKKLLFYEKEL